MNRTTKIGTVAVLAATLSMATWAASGPERDGEGPSQQQRAKFEERREANFQKRLAELSPEEQRLAQAMRPLHDSMMRLTRDYRRKAKDGVHPRSLAAERGAIVALDAEIQRVRAENREAWLDMLARRNSPMDPGGSMRHGRHQRKESRTGGSPGHECPMMHGGDETPIPPGS